MKKKYLTLEMEITEFDEEDVITNSDITNSDTGEGGDDNDEVD